MTTSAFNALHREISQFSIDAEFLVYGFDKFGDGHIFTFENGITKSCDKAGMWAIGSGHQGALSTLFFSAKQYRFNQNGTLPATIYASLAAKYMAESAEGVGTRTFVAVNRFNYMSGYVDVHFLERFRAQWFKRHAMKFPVSAMAALEEHYKPGKKKVERTKETSPKPSTSRT